MMCVALRRPPWHIAGMERDCNISVNDASEKGVKPCVTLSAEDLIRLQPLNQFKRLEVRAVSFRTSAAPSIPLEGPI